MASSPPALPRFIAHGQDAPLLVLMQGMTMLCEAGSMADIWQMTWAQISVIHGGMLADSIGLGKVGTNQPSSLISS